MEKPFIKTIYGYFRNNTISHSKGVIDVLTYGIIRKECDNRWGFFNILWHKKGKKWIVIQFMEY